MSKNSPPGNNGGYINLPYEYPDVDIVNFDDGQSGSGILNPDDLTRYGAESFYDSSTSINSVSSSHLDTYNSYGDQSHNLFSNTHYGNQSERLPTYASYSDQPQSLSTNTVPYGDQSQTNTLYGNQFPSSLQNTYHNNLGMTPNMAQSFDDMSLENQQASQRNRRRRRDNPNRGGRQEDDPDRQHRDIYGNSFPNLHKKL